MSLKDLFAHPRWRGEDALADEAVGFAGGQLVRSACILLFWPLLSSLLGSSGRFAPLVIVLLVLPPVVAFVPRFSGSLTFARTVSLAVTLSVLALLRVELVGAGANVLQPGELAALGLSIAALASGLLASAGRPDRNWGIAVLAEFHCSAAQ